MEREIRVATEQMKDAIGDVTPNHMIMMGGDVRFAASEITGKPMGDKLIEVKLKDFEKFMEQILKRSPENLVTSFHMSLPDAQLLGPALVTQLTIAREFGVDRIAVANINLRDSLIQEMAEGLSWSDSIRHQIIRSATQLGRKYNFREELSLIHI